MAYKKQNFVDGQVLKAEHLNHIENGIADLDLVDENRLVLKDRATGIKYELYVSNGKLTMSKSED